jgi:hypothetical protein
LQNAWSRTQNWPDVEHTGWVSCSSSGTVIYLLTFMLVIWLVWENFIWSENNVSFIHTWILWKPHWILN